MLTSEAGEDTLQGPDTSPMGADAPEERTKMNRRENIKVLVRIRPILEHETGPLAVVVGEDTNAIRVNGATSNKQLQCSYDAVIGPEVSQNSMFSHFRECTSAVLGGVNSTIFAYGQTGSGKTYTMFGPDSEFGAPSPTHEHGVIPLAVKDLFKGLVRRVVADKNEQCVHAVPPSI